MENAESLVWTPTVDRWGGQISVDGELTLWWSLVKNTADNVASLLETLLSLLVRN